MYHAAMGIHEPREGLRCACAVMGALALIACGPPAVEPAVPPAPVTTSQPAPSAAVKDAPAPDQPPAAESAEEPATPALPSATAEATIDSVRFVIRGEASQKGKGWALTMRVAASAPANTQIHLFGVNNGLWLSGGFRGTAGMQTGGFRESGTPSGVPITAANPTKLERVYPRDERDALVGAGEAIDAILETNICPSAKQVAQCHRVRVAKVRLSVPLEGEPSVTIWPGSDAGSSK